MSRKKEMSLSPENRVARTAGLGKAPSLPIANLTRLGSESQSKASEMPSEGLPPNSTAEAAPEEDISREVADSSKEPGEYCKYEMQHSNLQMLGIGIIRGKKSSQISRTKKRQQSQRSRWIKNAPQFAHCTAASWRRGTCRSIVHATHLYNEIFTCDYLGAARLPTKRMITHPIKKVIGAISQNFR